MGKGRSFDLAAMMETVSKLDTTAAAPQVRMISLEDILANRDNFYRVSKEELKPLADSIALDGLQQYPVVMPHPEETGKYLLLSGHRRVAAIRQLVKEDGREDLRLVPCTVREYASRNMAELQLILANSTARVPEEFQRRLAVISTDISGSAAEQILKKYGEGWRWEPEQQCPDGKACKRGDAFLRHDLEHPYDMCGVEKCCLKCERAKTAYSPCDRMCSRAQAVRKDKRDKEKARSEEEKQKQIEQFKAETKLNAQRVLKAVEAAGLTDE